MRGEFGGECSTVTAAQIDSSEYQAICGYLGMPGRLQLFRRIVGGYTVAVQFSRRARLAVVLVSGLTRQNALRLSVDLFAGVEAC